MDTIPGLAELVRNYRRKDLAARARMIWFFLLTGL